MAASGKKASGKKEQPAQRGHKKESEVQGHGGKKAPGKKAPGKKSAAPEVQGHVHKKGVSRRGIDLEGGKR